MSLFFSLNTMKKKMLDNTPGRLGEETSEFKARLGYLVTSRLVWAT